jgi:outer membrane protein
MKKRITGLSLASLTLLAASTAMAQSGGSVLVKGGVNHIAPQVSSGDLSQPSPPGAKVDVKSASAAFLTLSYMATDEISIETYAGLPYKHDVVAAGSLASVGKLGTVKQVSPSLFAQYRFLSTSSSFRPYAGLGLTYTYFYDEEGSPTLSKLTNPGGPPTTMSVKSAFGPSLQAGVSFQLSDRWYIDASVVKTWIKSTATLSTGQTIDVKLDPVSTNIALGYRF